MNSLRNWFETKTSLSETNSPKITFTGVKTLELNTLKTQTQKCNNALTFYFVNMVF